MAGAPLALHDVHAAAGAAFAERGGFALPARYGPPERAAEEYQAARSGVALTDLSDRGVLAVEGPLRQTFLHSILSNEVLALKPGQGRRAALMDVKGHILVLLRVLVAEDKVLLEAPRDRMRRLEETLQHYRVAAPVRFLTTPLVVLGVLGPKAAAALAEAGYPVPEGFPPDAHATAGPAGAEVRVVRAGDLPLEGYVVYVAPEQAAAVWGGLSAAGAVALGRDALDTLRVEEGKPWYGPDITEENLLHETGLVSEYHSPTKGCYVGQEVIARLEARGGNVNKALRGLRLSAAATPGSAVLAEAREVGRTATSVVSPRLGPIALAYVHRKHFQPGTAVEVGGHPATVAALPFTG